VGKIRFVSGVLVGPVLAIHLLLSSAAGPARAADCNQAAALAGEAARLSARDLTGAGGRLAKAVTLCPQSAVLNFNLAMIYYKLGRNGEAREQLEQAIGKDAAYAKAYNALANLIFADEKGDQAKARIYAQRAVDLEPGNTKFKDTLAKSAAPKYPALLSMQVNLADANGNGVLEAGESGTLTVTITNSGKGAGVDVTINPVITVKIPGVNIASPKTIEKVPPGANIRLDFPITTEEAALTTDKLKISVNAKEKYGFDPDPLVIAMATMANVPPNLKVADIGIVDQSENGQIEPMEIVDITARIQNAGLGNARGVKARVVIGPEVFLAGGSRSEFDLGTMAGGAYKDIVFSIYTSKRATGIPVAVALTEERPEFNVERPLNLAFNRPVKSAPSEIMVAANLSQIAGGEEAQALASLSVDVDIAPKTGLVKPDAVAVVIGNKDYENPLVPRVDYAVRDASVMRQYLVDTMGFAPQNVIYLQNASQTDFLKVFGNKEDHRGELYSRIRKGKSDLFIFYSGHGAPDSNTGRVYLLPTGADPGAIKFTGYSLDLLYDNLTKTGKEKEIKSLAVVFDACFSGMSNDGAVISEASSIGIRPKLPLFSLPNAAVITSSAGGQISSWYKEKRHGLFTYFFLKSVKDTVESGKPLTLEGVKASLLDVDSVNDYAYRLYKREQVPEVAGNLSIVLIDKGSVRPQTGGKGR